MHNATAQVPRLDKILNEISHINETLTAISAKEVLFIISITFLAILGLIQITLFILDRKHRNKQSGVPQAIVIQPNASGDKSSKSQKDRASAYEKDILPSKSMKMKVSILPGQMSSKRSKEGSEDLQFPVIKETSSDKVSKKMAEQSPVGTGGPNNNNTTTTIAQNNIQQQNPNPIQNQVLDITMTSNKTVPSTSSSSPSVASIQANNEQGSSLAPTQTPNAAIPSKSSTSSDGMTSFTVPEGLTNASSAPKSSASGPQIAGNPALSTGPSTPSATTLSGNEQSKQSTDGTKEEGKGTTTQGNIDKKI